MKLLERDKSGLKQLAVPPRILHLPDIEFDGTTADECLEFIASVGLILDEWQAFLVRCSLLERINPAFQRHLVPKWLVREFAYLVARQNGKGAILTARAITDLFFLKHYNKAGREEPGLVVYTAHQFKTAREAFLRLREIIEGSPDLRKKMKAGRNHGIRTAVGEEGFELANGNRLRYLARSTGGSGRGFTIHSLHIDEAQELPKLALDALIYTQSALYNPQRLVTGTVPDESNNGEAWTGIRDKGRGGASRISGWAEWSPDDEDPTVRSELLRPGARIALDIDPDRKYTIATNPAYQIRIETEAIDDEQESMSPDSYRRERLSWWPKKGDLHLILRNWPKLHDADSQIVGAPVFALEVSEDRAYSGIVVAGTRADGQVHLETVEYRPGLDWTVPRMKDLVLKWRPQVVLLDVGGPAGPLATEFDDLDLKYRPLQVREFSTACMTFYDIVNASQLRYLKHPSMELAAQNAKWRTLGQGRAWDRKVEEDVSLLTAGSMAVWGLISGAEYPEEKETKVKQVSHAMYGFR